MSKRELTELRSRVNSQMSIIDVLRKENEGLRRGSIKLDGEREIYKLNLLIRDQSRTIERLESTVTMLRSQPTVDSGFLPSEIKRRLKMLCHPDRHNNSEMSTKVSQWLNRL